MQKDSFVEQIIPAKTPYVFFARLGVAVVMLVTGFLLIVNHILLALAFILMGMIFFNMVKDERKVEYEYTFSNTHVEVAIIYNKAKRQELRGFDLDEISVIVPGTSKRFANIPKLQVYDYTSGLEDEGIVMFYYEKSGKKYLFRLQPDEKAMEHIKLFAKGKMSEF